MASVFTLSIGGEDRLTPRMAWLDEMPGILRVACLLAPMGLT